MDYEIIHKKKVGYDSCIKCQACGVELHENMEYYRIEQKRDRRFTDLYLCGSCYLLREEGKKNQPPVGTSG